MELPPLQPPPAETGAGELITLADVIQLSDARLRGDREAPLSPAEIRQLRQLAAAAPKIMRMLASAEVGRQMCPTWRRVQDETARRAGAHE